MASNLNSSHIFRLTVTGCISGAIGPEGGSDANGRAAGAAGSSVWLRAQGGVRTNRRSI